MIIARTSALALLAAAVALTAQAQPPAPAGARAGGFSQPQMRQLYAARHAERLRALHNALNIRPDQETAFSAFAATMGPLGPADGPRAWGAPDLSGKADDMASLTTPERLDRMAQRLQDHMARERARFERRAAATKALYAVLSPDQRRTLDALPALGGHGHGRGGGHERGGAAG